MLRWILAAAVVAVVLLLLPPCGHKGLIGTYRDAVKTGSLTFRDDYTFEGRTDKPEKHTFVGTYAMEGNLVLMRISRFDGQDPIDVTYSIKRAKLSDDQRTLTAEDGSVLTRQ